MATAKERLAQMRDSAAKAVDTVEADSALREAVVEVEQAADSAKVAVEADEGASERSKAVVLAAHDLMCVTTLPIAPRCAARGFAFSRPLCPGPPRRGPRSVRVGAGPPPGSRGSTNGPPPAPIDVGV